MSLNCAGMRDIVLDFVWRVRRTFSPSGWCFLSCDHTGWIFYISLLFENSINQSILYIKARDESNNHEEKLRNKYNGNGGLLPDIIVLTHGYYHWGTRLNTM